MKIPNGDGTFLRLATAFTLIPVVLALIWVPLLQPGYALMVALLVLLGASEFYKMAKHADIKSVTRSGLLLTVLLAISAGYASRYGIDSGALLLVAIFLLAMIHLFTLNNTIAGVSTSVLGLVYVGYCGSFFIALHQHPVVGAALVTTLFFIIGCSDTGAYFIGKAIGRHKLAPKISPKKTIEGSLAALASGALAGAFLYWLKGQMNWSTYPTWPLAAYMVTGISLSVVGQLGDLFESMLKRNAGVKDSGAVFPGHGGVLDRCDAFLFGAPALYYLVLFLDAWSR